MSFRPTQHPDELISASVTGDLSGSERAALDQHLATCERCRGTLQAFSEERRLLGAMHHAAPPRDLGARVRTAVESGAGRQAWWRRPSTLVGFVASLATVAAGLLAVVVIGNLTDPGPVAHGTASPTAASSEEVPTPTPTPASFEPSPDSSPAETPVPGPSIDPEPIAMLGYTLADQQPELTVTIDESTRPIEVPRHGSPVNAALSPDGDWLAFQLLGEGSDLVDTYAYRISDETLVPLVESGRDSPFARLRWSEDGSLLAYTAVTMDGSADAWVFSTLDETATPRQVTNTGSTFSADFHGGTEDEAWLWVSSAADGAPTTYRVAVPRDGSVGEPVDPAQAAVLREYPGVFLPLVAPLPLVEPAQQPPAALWRGVMARDGSGWYFVREGMPYVTYANLEGDFDLSFAQQPLFDTLTPATSGQAFRSARFEWAPDGIGLAVWDAAWEGTQQPEGFPDQQRVYFARPLDGVFIGPQQALDAADTDGGQVIDVSLAGGMHLAITVQTAAGAEGGSYGPTAELRLVKRNLGDVADEVSVIGQERRWFGPAAYPYALAPSD